MAFNPFSPFVSRKCRGTLKTTLNKCNRRKFIFLSVAKKKYTKKTRQDSKRTDLARGFLVEAGMSRRASTSAKGASSSSAKKEVPAKLVEPAEVVPGTSPLRASRRSGIEEFLEIPAQPPRIRSRVKQEPNPQAKQNNLETETESRNVTKQSHADTSAPPKMLKVRLTTLCTSQSNSLKT